MDARLTGAAPIVAPATDPPSAETCGTRGWRIALESPMRVAETLPGLLHHTLSEVLFGYSLWWSEGSEQISPSLLLCQGLPVGSGFTTLYTGDWARGEWWDLGSLAPVPGT
jgi:type VI secretion system protein ImpM